MPQPQDLLESLRFPFGILTRRFAEQPVHFLFKRSHSKVRQSVRNESLQFNATRSVLFTSRPPPCNANGIPLQIIRWQLWRARSPLPHETCPFVLIACVMPARGAERRGVASRGTSSSSNSQSPSLVGVRLSADFPSFSSFAQDSPRTRHFFFKVKMVWSDVRRLISVLCSLL